MSSRIENYLGFPSGLSGGDLAARRCSGPAIKGSGHWLMEEAPGKVIPQLVAFINKSN